MALANAAGRHTSPTVPGRERYARLWPPLLLGLLITLVLLYLAYQRAAAVGWQDDVGVASGPDDWNTYKLYALDILHGDIFLSLVSGPYTGPGGILYPYVLAGFFGLLSDNVQRVYVVQSGALGLSVFAFYAAYRRVFSYWVGIAYLLAVSVYLYLDWYVNYANRLLTENLVLLFIPLALMFLFRAYASGSWPGGAGAGALLGLALLTRPNLLPAAMGISLVWIVYACRERRGRAAAVAFSVAWVAVLGLTEVRNYAVTHQLSLAAFTSREDLYAPNHSGVDAYLPGSPAELLAAPGRAFDIYLHRALFILGDLPALEPDFRVRPHWALAWLAFAAYTVYRVWHRQSLPLAFWEAASYSYLVLYLGPILAVGFFISNYGFRYLVPAVPVLLVFGFRLLDLGVAAIQRRIDTRVAHRALV